MAGSNNEPTSVDTAQQVLPQGQPSVSPPTTKHEAYQRSMARKHLITRRHNIIFGVMKKHADTRAPHICKRQYQALRQLKADRIAAQGKYDQFPDLAQDLFDDIEDVSLSSCDRIEAFRSLSSGHYTRFRLPPLSAQAEGSRRAEPVSLPERSSGRHSRRKQKESTRHKNKPPPVLLNRHQLPTIQEEPRDASKPNKERVRRAVARHRKREQLRRKVYRKQRQARQPSGLQGVHKVRSHKASARFRKRPRKQYKPRRTRTLMWRRTRIARGPADIPPLQYATFWFKCKKMRDVDRPGIYDTFAADCIDDHGKLTLAGNLDGPSNLRTLRRLIHPYNDGYAKTLCLVDYPQADLSMAPREYVSHLGGDKQLRLGEISQCIADGGRMVATANTFLQLHFELVLLFARAGGFPRNDNAKDCKDCAVNTAHLVDFGAPADSWTSVTPAGLRLPTHNIHVHDLRVEIEVKSFRGCDGPLLLEQAGISPRVFDVLAPEFEAFHVSPWRVGDEYSDVARAFIARSTVYAVRVMATIDKSGFRDQKMLLGMAGWVAPPQYVRYHKQQLRNKAEAAAEAAVEAAKLAASDDADDDDNDNCDTDTDSDDDDDVYSMHLSMSLGRLSVAARPATLPLKVADARWAGFTTQLVAALTRAQHSHALPAVIVRPQDVADKGAAALPQAQGKTSRRANTACAQTAVQLHGYCGSVGAAPPPPVWTEMAAPALEDVLWMVHRMMHLEGGVSGFPRVAADFGVNWSLYADYDTGKQAMWAATNAFRSPASVARDHSRMLCGAYLDRTLPISGLYGAPPAGQ